MVEHPAVNRRVVGSSPTRGAKSLYKTFRLFFPMAYSLYILHSHSADKYYIGSSANPQRRLSFHNTIEKGFTARYRPWILVFEQSFPSKAEAQQMERKIKRWKNKFKIIDIVNGKFFL